MKKQEVYTLDGALNYLTIKRRAIIKEDPRVRFEVESVIHVDCCFVLQYNRY